MTRYRWGDRPLSYPHARLQPILERWFPAFVLVAIAALQLYLTQTAYLSPWKGGGFGMFGAIDAPDMRVIQAEALDQAGHLLQVDIYNALDDRTILRTRTLPRQRDLEQIAPQLIALPVVPTTIQRQGIYDKLQTYHSDIPATQDLIQGDGFSAAPGLPTDLSLDLSSDLPSDLLPHPLTQPIYRFKTMFDPDVPGTAKTLKAIRLQWWRIRFDQTHHRLWAEPLSPMVEAGVWP